MPQIETAPLSLFEVKLDKESHTPLYAQLYEKIKNMVLEKNLYPGSRMPSIRKLSALLGINQVTVVSAYKQLEAEGFIYKRSGSGTFVCEFLPVPQSGKKTQSSFITDELYLQDDLYLINNGQIKIDRDTINFASATPAPDLFPIDDFKLAMDEVLDRDKGNAFGYQESQGFFPLRECVCNILAGTGITCSPEHVQIISGAQQGIDIISKAFLSQDDAIITESPTYTGAIAVFKSRGAQIIDIEMEKDGPDLKVLEYNLKKYRPKLIYSIPSFQNPTGCSYSNGKRLEILKLAKKYNVYIIEDDYVSDLDFEGKGYKSLKSMDRENRVIFIKSFSKIFMPGLRLGFMVTPPEIQGRILEVKHSTDISTSGLIQRAFDLYIRKGFWDKHLKFMHRVYKERYFKMVDSLDKYLPENARYIRPGGGLNIWLSLPYGTSTSRLLKEAASIGVVFAPGKIFYSSTAISELNSIRLSFAAVHPDKIEEGIMALCKLLKAREEKNSVKNLPLL